MTSLICVITAAFTLFVFILYSLAYSRGYKAGLEQSMANFVWHEERLRDDREDL